MTARTFAYRSGDYTTTRFVCDARPRGVRFTIEEANKRYTPHVYRVRFHLRQTPTAVNLGGAALGQSPAGAETGSGRWTWDAGQRVLTVALDDTAGLTHSLEVALDGVALPARLPPVLIADKIDLYDETAAAPHPLPKMLPAPALPGRVKAVNYDNGGEGVAFHCGRPAPVPAVYRADDIGCVECGDAGGGFALRSLQAGEWARYTVDANNGGYFDLTARMAGDGRFRLDIDGQTIADITASADSAAWHDVKVANVYLNPGESGLVLYVERPGFALNYLDFQPAADPPRVYDAALCHYTGTADLRHLGGGFGGHGTLFSLGRSGSSATFGLLGSAGGPGIVRIYYRNRQGKPVALSCALDAAPAQKIVLPPTHGDGWQAFDLPVTLEPGAHRLALRGLEEGWDSVQLDHLEVMPR